MSRQSRKPQPTTDRQRDPGSGPGADAGAERANDTTQDRIRTDDALTAARLAGLDARVVVRPTIVLGPRGPSGFKLDGSTLRGVLVPGSVPAAPQQAEDPEAFGLVTLPPSLVDELVTGPLPELADTQATNYRGDDCQTIRLAPEAAAQLELHPASAPAWDGSLSLAETSVVRQPVSEDAATWALGSVEEAMPRPLPPPPPSAARRRAPDAPLGQTRRSPAPPPRAASRASLPIWAWLLAGLAAITMLVAYVLTSSLLSREPSPRLEPGFGAVSAQHGPTSAAVSGEHGHAVASPAR